MKSWISHIILFSLCLLINCEKSFDSIVPQKSDPPEPPIITTVPPVANLMFIRGEDIYYGDIYFLDTLGVETRLTFEGVVVLPQIYFPIFSPDGSKIAYVSGKEGNNEIYLMNSDGTNQLNLTCHPSRDDTPKFAPDGSYLIFNSDRDGNFDIYSMNLDGTNKTNLTQQDSTNSTLPAFSPDGSKIAFCSKRDGDWEIYIMDTDGNNQQNLTNYHTTPFQHDLKPLFSPDGSKILFASGRDRQGAFYTMNIDGSNQKFFVQVAVLGAEAWQSKIFTTDGNSVIFERDIPEEPYSWGIYIIDIEGINRRQLSIRAKHPTLSPDGSKIAFYSNRDDFWNHELYEMNIDGTEQVRLTDNDLYDQMPVYQPIQR